MNYKHITLSLLGTLLLTSCLDENPRDQLPQEEAYDTAKNLYLNSVATLYNYIGGNADGQGLQGTVRGVYDLNTFTTDEAILPTRGGDWYDGGLWQGLYLHQWTDEDAPLKDTWNYLYKVIVLCNQSLNRLNTYSSLLTVAQLEQYQAEVRAIRAMYYYYLLDLFARVPIVDNDRVSLKDVKQSSRSQVFRFVVNELQAVEPLLMPERSNLEGSCYGRLTRPVAWFLLCKLALNAEVYADDNWTDGNRPQGTSITFTVDGKPLNAWQACITYADKLSAFGYQLEDSYASNFAVHNENSAENIFTIPMDKMLYANQFCYLFRSRHYNHGSAIGMDAENGTSATRSAVLTYGYGTGNVDSRYAVNFYSDTLFVDGNVVYLDNGEPLVYRPLEVQLDLTGTTYEKTAGARMAKYEIDRTAHADGKLQENDIVLFRYADVVLMKAEALMRLGEDGSALFNTVRQRSGMPERELNEQTLLDERLMELQWEGWRRQDLIRFDRFHRAYDQRTPSSGESSRYTTVFPIPGSALDLNNNLTQNWGYE